jgi:Cu-Zn family superoxide dismutase
MKMPEQASAVFRTEKVKGEVIATQHKSGTKLHAKFTMLPKGKHGFHIHRAGDLRGEGCMGACEHYHLGKPCTHGDRPRRGVTRKIRHTGDLGNIQLKGAVANYSYFLKNVRVHDLYGRSIIVHEDEDDLGKGTEHDSHTTGHSGARIACALFGRVTCSNRNTRKQSHK